MSIDDIDIRENRLRRMSVRVAGQSRGYTIALTDQFITDDAERTHGPRLNIVVDGAGTAMPIEDWPAICAAVEELRAEWKKRFEEKETKHARRS